MRVLLITRLHDEREIYRIGLASLGYSVTCRSPGEIGIDMTSPDVILLDIDRPTDWAFVELLTRSYPAVPIVIITAAVRPDRANRERAVALNCAAFVGKPCTHLDLAHVVSLVLDGHRGIELTSGSSASARWRLPFDETELREGTPPDKPSRPNE